MSMCVCVCVCVYASVYEKKKIHTNTLILDLRNKDVKGLGHSA